jgi:hypothetical protein
MIMEDELNMTYDLGSLSFYDTNPRTEEQLRDPTEIQKSLKYNMAKLKSKLIAYQKDQEVEQEVRPLAAKIIDFSKSTYRVECFDYILHEHWC